MWNSIEQILRPVDLAEALALGHGSGTAMLAGGSYLVATRDPAIHTLVDIHYLLDDERTTTEKGWSVGAGASLQSLCESPFPELNQALIASCPSKNIRNQRTLGGELAWGRQDSDLLVWLQASGTRLELNGTAPLVSLAGWDGTGIITRILIPENNTRLERVALLESAPAFVIVAVNQQPALIKLAVGGQVAQIKYFQIKTPPEENAIRALMETIGSLFSDDYLGSRDYKLQLVSNLLPELVA